MRGDRTDCYKHDRNIGVSGPMRAALWGYLIIALTFGGAGIWASRAEISSASVAHGQVRLAGQRKVVQHLEGGIVEEIKIREADWVEQGDVLLVLASVAARADVERMAQQVLEVRAVEARLVAEGAVTPDLDAPEIAFPDTLDNENIRRGQQDIYRDRLAILQSRSEILQAQIAQLENQKIGLRQQVVALEERVALQDEVLRRLSRGEARGVVEGNQLVQRQDGLIQIKAALGQARSQIAQADVAMGEARLELLKLRQEFKGRANMELGDVRQRYGELREALRVAEDRLARAEVRAPVSGSVQGLKVSTVGSVVRPGEVLMEIVPRDDRLLVAAQVAPVDIDNVAIGMEVELRFPAFKARLMPKIIGRVESVSRDIIAAENGVGYYLAEVYVPDVDLPQEVAEGLTPGMPAEAVIVNGSRTVLTYLLSPLADAMMYGLREE